MLKLLQLLLLGHAHEWEVEETLFCKRYDGTTSKKIYVLKCRHCGNIKDKRIHSGGD